MSIKWISCGLIFLACLALASEGCGALRRRERCLTELDGLLTAFLGEIRFGMQPLPVLLERMGERPSGGGFQAAAKELAKRDGRSAGECFRAGVGGSYPELTNEDRQVLLALGEGLGNCDRETQCRQIEAVQDRLRTQQLAARERRAKNTRLYWGLGILGGLFLVLLFM